jgi:alpha-1,6-mannosyltransferase
MGALIVAGLAIGGLLAAVILLYVNVPPGYDVPYGLSLNSPELFRSLWRYPIFSAEPGTFGMLAALTIVLLWVVYFGAWAIVRGCTAPGSRRQLAFAIAAFGLLYHVGLALAMPPVLSTDIYHYALFGRMVAFYGLNPYVVPGSAISGDTLWAFVGWRDVTTHYGPLWTLISAGAAAVGGQGILVTVLTFKGLAALFNLANCLLVSLLARRLGGGDGRSALLLYAWNPLILIETAGSGHNDAAMMTFALLGLLLAARGRLLLGLAALVLSVLLKYLTALLLFFFVLACLAKQPTWRRATALAARMGALGGLMVIGLFLPFWAGPQGFERLVSVGAPFKTPVRVVLRDWLVNLLAGQGDFSWARAAAEQYVILALHLGFVALVLLLARATLVEKPDWPRVLELWGVASLVYMTVVYGWNLPWFMVAMLATTCVVLRSRLSLRLLALCHGVGLVWMLPYAVLVEL